MRPLLLLLTAGLLAGCAASATPRSYPYLGSATAASPLPLGGISEQDAIRLAGQHVGPTATFAAATAGTYGALALDPNAQPPNPLPSHVVWAVRYTGEFVICPPLAAPSAGAPDPPPCWSPRPGTTVVYLDYLTGQWLTTESVSPEP